MTNNQFRCNSIYDPNGNWTGASNETATFHEFFNKLYKQYAVLKATAYFTLRPQNDFDITTMNAYTLKWGVFINDDQTFDGGPHSWQEMAQHPMGKYKTMVVGNNNKSQTIKIVYNVKQYPVDKDNIALFGSNPTRSVWFTPWWALAADTAIFPPPEAPTQYFIMDTHITYKCMAYEPRDFFNTSIGMKQGE